MRVGLPIDNRGTFLEKLLTEHKIKVLEKTFHGMQTDFASNESLPVITSCGRHLFAYFQMSLTLFLPIGITCEGKG